MSEDWQDRTRQLLTPPQMARLAGAHVLIAGLGGVGGAAAEALARAGVGRMTLVDGDLVHLTNLNRQILATRSSLGLPKTDVARARLLDINPNLKLQCLHEFLRDERLVAVVRAGYDYIVDAIDTLSPKLFLLKTALEAGIPVVSSMGAAGKLDPSQVRVGSFWEVDTCHLARHLRKRLRRMGIDQDFWAVSSRERTPAQAVEYCDLEQNKKSRVGVISYLPNLFGLMAAGVVVQDLLARQ